MRAGLAISDSYLVEQVREGNLDSYLQLWERHVAAARAVAASAPVSGLDQESAVNRAFARVLEQITLDLDPMGAFPPYLLHMVHLELGAADRDVLPLTNVLRAFHRLPVRVQSMLWYHVVEGRSPGATALRVGEDVDTLTVSLAESIAELRAEWLVELICDPAISDPCAWLVQRADARARSELGPISTERFDRHLAGCTVCTTFLSGLDHFPDVLRAAYTPLFQVQAPQD